MFGLSYYHDCKDAGFKCILDDIADGTGLTGPYVRRLHKRYKIEHDLDKPKKDTK